MKEKHKNCNIIKHKIIDFNIRQKTILKQINLEISHLKKTISVNGFRKGTIPENMLYERYKDEILKKSILYIAKKKFLDFIKNKKINVIKNPKYIFKQPFSKNDTCFSVKFYKHSKFFIDNIKNKKIIEPKVYITHSDKSFFLKKMYENYFVWKTKKIKKIENHDKITVSFRIKKNQYYLKQYEINNFSFIIGMHDILPEINSHLLGKKINDICTIKTIFPCDYHLKNLQGEKVSILLLIKNVETKHLSKQMKSKFLNNIKTWSCDEIQKKIKQESKSLQLLYIKNQLINILLKKNTFFFSETLIRDEANALCNNYFTQCQENTNVLFKPYSQLEIQSKVKKNLILNLIFKMIINENNISITKKLVENFFTNHSKNSSEKLLGINNYLKNRSFQSQINQLIVEEQIYFVLLNKIKKIKKFFSFQRLLKLHEN